MNNLNVKNVLSIKMKRENREREYTKSLVKSVLSRIEIKKKNCSNELYFEVPNFVPGLPLIDSIKICKMLKEELDDLGYKTEYLYENKIYIHWEKKEKVHLHIPHIIKKIKTKIYLNAYENKDNCVYQIPIFIPGKPLYDLYETTLIVKKILKECGFVCKIIYANNIYISWNIEDLEKQYNLEIEFRTKQENKKLEKKKYKKMKKKYYEKFKNPDKTKTKQELKNELESDESESEQEDYSKYFNIQQTEDNEHQNYFRYFSKFPSSKENRIKHTKSYKNNTRTFFPVEYTDPKELSKVSFPNNKVKRLSRKHDKIIYDNNYNPVVRNNVEDCMSNLEKLKSEVNRIKNN